MRFAYDLLVRSERAKDSLGISTVFKSWLASLLDASKAGSHKSSKGVPSNNTSTYARFDCHDLDSIDKVHLTEARGGAEQGDKHNQLNSYPLNTISVQSRIEVNWYGRICNADE
ncbi:MAG: hypothetical protein L6R42_001520 [Xanthoria sp. 1 TBL-2021]|nr:MAG: hypothetical protein L6R42_001520 [Xanthoria sp. 1 TBL-2021]